MNKKIDLILASASPRRSEILTSLGVDFRVLVSDADESSDATDAGAHVESIARAKCLAVADSLGGVENIDGDKMILAADTLVVADSEFLGKPSDAEDAARMLRQLSGREHFVVTGFAVCYDGRVSVSHEKTVVRFAEMTDSDIDSYVDSGEPFGKAGAYAIQGRGARYIEGITGDYFNVVGLPAHKIFDFVRREFGVEL
ncbi:MAG: septum formation protein Maf [Clostridia bacterium]|nr:septum formation protein Maf [Clostridia bacterium]